MDRLLKLVLTRVSSRRHLSCIEQCRHPRDRIVVTSPILDQLEAKCEKIPPSPPKPLQKVAVIGAASDIGQISCLFLKQQRVIKHLAMFDEPPNNVLGHCNDLAHIDTSTAAEAYQGSPTLKCALDKADVVLVCGGRYPAAPCCQMSDYCLFYYNACFVRIVATAVSRFCPDAILCIQVPPVDATYSLARHILKKYKAYDPRRLLGLNSITAMRANQMYCELAKLDPTKLYCPCVGGTCYSTRVPVFSAYKYHICVLVEQGGPENVANLTKMVREADTRVCQMKCNEQAHLSTGFATARAVTSIMHGMFEKRGFLDSALVEQPNPEACYGMKICATPVTVTNGGISQYHIPLLKDTEQKLLEESKSELEERLEMGRCYARGEDYCPPCECPFCCYEPSLGCTLAGASEPKQRRAKN